jgi:N-acylglucosamine 2-epimerase/mannose-6-phosphate isomerase
VFSHAALLGIGPADGLEKAWRAYEFMREAWSPGTGWPRRLTRDGAILDPTPDLYDHAFILLALAWLSKATDETAPLDTAVETLDFVKTRFAHPSGAGWLSELPDGASLQNPHMHMLESLLALHSTTGQARFLEEADKIVALFSDRLFQPDPGVIPEYFDRQWRPEAGRDGRRVEPGHQLEWFWLMERHLAAGGRGAPEKMRAIFDFAERAFSAGEHGLAVNEVDLDGAALDGDYRLWPQTEALKAYLAVERLAGAPQGEAISRIYGNLTGRFIDRPAPGLWVDRLDRGGRPLVKDIPGSSLYHIFIAFVDLGGRFAE